MRRCWAWGNIAAKPAPSATEKMTCRDVRLCVLLACHSVDEFLK